MSCGYKVSETRADSVMIIISDQILSPSDTKWTHRPFEIMLSYELYIAGEFEKIENSQQSSN